MAYINATTEYVGYPENGIYGADVLAVDSTDTIPADSSVLIKDKRMHAVVGQMAANGDVDNMVYYNFHDTSYPELYNHDEVLAAYGITPTAGE